MHYFNEEVECEYVPQKEKKQVYKFRYGIKPEEENLYENLLDCKGIDFNHKALGGEEQEDTTTLTVEENTLLLIKPTAMIYKDHIKKRIFEEGYTTLQEKTVWLTSEQMSEFYIEHYGKTWFPKFILKMISGPVHIMFLAKYNAIEDLNTLMGPKRVSDARKDYPYSLRALYGLRGDSATNGLHGSDNQKAAQREIRFFFPQAIPEPIPDVMEYIDYIEENIHEVVLKGILELKKEKPIQPIAWLSDWFLHNSKDTPQLEPEGLMKELD